MYPILTLSLIPLHPHKYSLWRAFPSWTTATTPISHYLYPFTIPITFFMYLPLRFPHLFLIYDVLLGYVRSVM